MNKKITVEQIKNAVKWSKESGIETKGFFLLNYPGETIETTEKTIALSRELDLDFAGFNLTVPLLGTQIRKEIEGKFHIEGKYWNNPDAPFGNIFYFYFKEYNANQKIQEANNSAETAKKQVVDLSEKQTKAQIEIANLIKKEQELHQQLKETEESAKAAKKQINDLSDYGEVATYDFKGYQESGITLSPFTPVSKWTNGYLTVSNNTYLFDCKPNAIKHYQEMIDKYPKFPFPYLALSGCLLKNQDPSWKKYATKAKSILEITTQIPLHCKAHDGWLTQVNKILDPNQIKDVYIHGAVQSPK